jgi:hypothetical protein
MDKKIKNISARVSFSENSEKTTIIIIPDFDTRKQLLLTIWILLWSIGGFIMIIQLFGDYTNEEKMFFTVWIFFWLYFEFFALHAWLWNKMGYEKIILKLNGLYYSKKIKNYGKTIFYEKNKIKDLRSSYESEKSLFTALANSYWVVGGEKIAFDYDFKEVNFGQKLNKKETPEILKIIGRFISEG